MIILDTDVLSIVQRATGQDYDHLVERLHAADDEVAVSIVSFEEGSRAVGGRLDTAARETSLKD